MTIDDALEAFKTLSQEDVFSGMLLDRDPVYQLSYLINYLLRVKSWVKNASDALATTPQVEFASAVASAHAVVNERLPRTARMLANAIEMQAVPLANVVAPMSKDSDPARDCMERQQEINRETLNGLSEADSLSERADVITDWGRDTKENLGQCLDDAFGQFDDANK
ncbi:MAG: hypothetical protein JWR74_825 [Polaromonas sp.]|nr:hypothetical protein [Polaromonas sp.]